MSDNTRDHHHHDDHAADIASIVHRARWLPIPTLAAASGLTVIHDKDTAYIVGAVIAWLLAFFWMGCVEMHDWQVCRRCSNPPRAYATERARAKVARRTHSKILKRAGQLLIIALVFHSILPKPYLDPWWAKVIAAVTYFVTVGWLMHHSIQMAHHRKRFHDECHIEWCRAGLKRKPRTKPSRCQLWFGHYGLWQITVLAPTTCVVGLYQTQHPGTIAAALYSVLLATLGFTTIAVAGFHGGEPCLACARSLPDNGGEAAERRMSWLRLFHHTGALALVTAFVLWAASWMTAGTVIAKILVCFAALTVLYWAVLERVHSPVRPWCPWCKDDGGDEADADVPDPSTSAPAPA